MRRAKNNSERDIRIATLEAKLEALSSRICGDGEDSVLTRLTRIEHTITSIYHDQGVLAGKVAIIAAVISAAIGIIYRILN